MLGLSRRSAEIAVFIDQIGNLPARRRCQGFHVVPKSGWRLAAHSLGGFGGKLTGGALGCRHNLKNRVCLLTTALQYDRFIDQKTGQLGKVITSGQVKSSQSNLSHDLRLLTVRTRGR